MSHQRSSALTTAPARSPRGVRWLAVLGIGTLAAGLVLAVASPAQAIEGGDGGGNGCITAEPEETTTVTSPTATSFSATNSTVTTSTSPEQKKESPSDGTSSTSNSVEEFRMAPPKPHFAADQSGKVNISPNCIAALVQWAPSAGGNAQVWFTKLESEVTSEHVGIEAGSSEPLATLQFESSGEGSAFYGVQIHQSLSPAGNYQQPTAVIDGGSYGNLFTLTGPECSPTECVWTVEYTASLRASGRALRSIVLPSGGPVVTITNVGLSRGGGTRVPTSTTTPTSTSTTSTSTTTTATSTTSAPVIATAIAVLGESESVSPAPAETVTVAGLAETGVGVDRYVSVAVLLMLLGAAMLVFAAGGLWRRERR